MNIHKSPSVPVGEGNQRKVSVRKLANKVLVVSQEVCQTLQTCPAVQKHNSKCQKAWRIQSTYRDVQHCWMRIKLSWCSIYMHRQQLQLTQYSVCHLALLPRSLPSHTYSGQWQNIVQLGLNAERSKTKGFACASWTLRNLAPPRASWKNPPYQVEAGPLEALNINQLQRRETQVWFAGPKKKNHLPLIQIVNVKDKQDGDSWHLSLACSSSTLMESEGCFFTAWD